MGSPEARAVFGHMTPDEARAFAELVGEAEDEGREWSTDALAMAIWAVAVARSRGYHLPPVVEPPKVMAKCL